MSSRVEVFGEALLVLDPAAHLWALRLCICIWHIGSCQKPTRCPIGLMVELPDSKEPEPDPRYIEGLELFDNKMFKRLGFHIGFF